jgi:hypothetical protein
VDRVRSAHRVRSATPSPSSQRSAVAVQGPSLDQGDGRSLVASARRRVDCGAAVAAASRRSSTDPVTRTATRGSRLSDSGLGQGDGTDPVTRTAARASRLSDSGLDQGDGARRGAVERRHAGAFERLGPVQTLCESLNSYYWGVTITKQSTQYITNCKRFLSLSSSVSLEVRAARCRREALRGRTASDRQTGAERGGWLGHAGRDKGHYPRHTETDNRHCPSHTGTGQGWLSESYATDKRSPSSHIMAMIAS